MFFKVSHRPVIIPTHEVDPETGGILTVVFPKTYFGEPLRLTWDHANKFGINLKLPTMLQLKTIYESSARQSLPVDDFMSDEVQTVGSKKIETVRCLSFRTGKEVCSPPTATCGTLFIMA